MTQRPASFAARRPAPLWWLVILGGIGLALAALILHQSLAAALFNDKRAQALSQWLNPRQVDLAVRRAEEALAANPPASPATLAAREADITKALLQAPLDSRLYRLLGVFDARRGDTQAATQKMRRAVALSVNETFALLWLINDGFTRGDLPDALDNINVLLLSQPNAIDLVAPALARLAEIPQMQPRLIALLAKPPRWHDRLFPALNKVATDPEAPARLMRALKGTAGAPSALDLRIYLNGLMNKNREQFAYAVWSEFLPEAQRPTANRVFNGSFEQAFSGVAFDWNLGEGSGVTLTATDRADRHGEKALLVEFTFGRAVMPRFVQMLALEPGRYRLSGSAMGEVLGRRGLRWSLTCSNGRDIGAGPEFLGRIASWQRFEVDLIVPADDCPLQTLLLVHAGRHAAEQFTTGAAWYDDLSISPLR